MLVQHCGVWYLDIQQFDLKFSVAMAMKGRYTIRLQVHTQININVRVYIYIYICNYQYMYIYIIHILYCCFMLVLYRNFLPICSHISSYHPLIIVYSSYRIFLFYPWPGSAPRAPGSEGVPRPGLPGDRRWMRWVLGAWAVPFSGSWGDFYGYYNWYNHGIFSPINWDKPW